jgi:hypothetical protein
VNTRISCKCVAHSRIHTHTHTHTHTQRDIWLNARRKAILCYSTQSAGKITFSVQTSKEDYSKNILVGKFYINIYNDCLCFGYIHRRLIVITTNHNIYDHSFIFNIIIMNIIKVLDLRTDPLKLTVFLVSPSSSSYSHIPPSPRFILESLLQ